jgi:hypothetical protein
MITVSALPDVGIRLSAGGRGVSAFALKPGQADDIVLQSVPEETPPTTVVCWPGEYDIDGVTIRGIGHDEGRQTSFLVVLDGIRCALPSAPLKEWTDAELQQVGEVDALVIPVADAKIIQALIDKLEPRVLIVPPGSADAELLRAIGAQDKEPVTEHKIKSLPQEGREVIVLA